MKIIIDRYRNFLTSLLPSVKETSQATAINSIQEFWANSEWHLSIYIQTFFEYKLLKSSVIINWVFKNLDKATINPFEESCFWGILESLLEKTSTKIQFFSEEMKKDPKNENIMEIEKFLGQEREENKNLLLLVFKKICLLLSECAQTQRSKFETLLQRFISLIRNYRNELDSIYERLDEDFFLLSNIPEMNKMIPYFKLLT